MHGVLFIDIKIRSTLSLVYEFKVVTDEVLNWTMYMYVWEEFNGMGSAQK